ncbi:uncharacterized protein [Dermacentor albipictus]|uniref:uncharacterized protein isoform X1 n=1 Tax=Dermacentor albipictus TaxID=60249 RepID=UPI0038FC0391
MSKGSEAYIVFKHLQRPQKWGNTWTGYVESQEKYDEFVSALAAFGISFKTLRTRPSLSVKGRLLLCTQRGGVSIKEDVPFKVVESKKRGCIFQKCSEEEATSELAATLTEDPESPGARKGLCPAMMFVKQIERYPEFRVPYLSQYSTRRGREAAVSTTISRLKLALKKEAAGKPVLRQRRIYITMDDHTCHHHHGSDSICEEQPVNTNVLQNKAEMAQPNRTSTRKIGSCLTYYVKEVLVADKPNPRISSDDCYATKRSINDHIQRALRKEGFSSVEQKGITRCVEELNEKSPMTSPLFFTYEQRRRRELQRRRIELQSDSERQAVQLDCDVLATVASECKTALLHCAHTNFMKNLMLKYFEVVVCMEAVYDRTNYALPVFLICFKTPSSYAVVGAFVIHFEMADCIEEMLDLLKASDSDTVSTKFWVVKHSQADIRAFSSSFPRSHPLLCNFHREQAWSGWRSEEASIASNISLVKKMLQEVACSKNEDGRKLVVEALEQSPYWQENKNLQEFICQKWLLVREILAKMHKYAFRFDNTDEDSETKSGKLQACLTQGGSRHEVRGLVRVFAKMISPESEVQALQVSTNSLPSYPLLHDTLPKFLHGKASTVTKQIMEHLTRAANYRRSEIKPGKEEGTFFVQSTAQSSSFDEVNINVPSCTCSYFVQNASPCRHLAAVLLLDEGWDFSRLPAAYRNEPHTKAHADADCASQQTVSKASEMEVCINVEQNEPHMTAYEYADSTSQEIISEASHMEVFIEAEPNEPHITAQEDVDSMSQEKISEASQMEACMKAEPNYPHAAAHEDADSTLWETISKASGMDVCIKVEPNEPDMTVCEGSNCTSQEMISKASEMELCVKLEPNEPHMTVYEGSNCTSLEMISKASQVEVCVKVEPNELDTRAHKNVDCASQEMISKALEMEACVKVERGVQPTEFLFERCTERHKVEVFRQSTSRTKSQIGAQIEEIDSLLCYVHDNTVLQRVLDKFNQVGALVERNVPGCSAVRIERETDEGHSSSKRKGVTPTASIKKKKDYSRPVHRMR